MGQWLNGLIVKVFSILNDSKILCSYGLMNSNHTSQNTSSGGWGVNVFSLVGKIKTPDVLCAIYVHGSLCS